MNTLYIVRGLPGSGKSTYALNHLANALHFEADRFFINDQLEYKFNAKLLGTAHEWCFSNVVRALRNGHDVVVSNTFVKVWEMKKYLDIKKEFGIDVNIKIIEIKTQFNNVHGVPEEKLQQMKNNWQEIPPDWDIKDITQITQSID